MSPPTITSYSDTEISLSWSSLTAPANGNAAVTSYELYWDNGAGTTPSIQLVKALTNTYEVGGGIVGGTNY